MITSMIVPRDGKKAEIQNELLSTWQQQPVSACPSHSPTSLKVAPVMIY